MSAYPAYSYDAWLTGLVDGDTLHCGVDLGMDVATNQTVRFYGINAPEMSTDVGKVAKQYAADWFTQNCPDGKFVLHTVKDKREKYGRYLGVIYALAGTTSLNDLMVSSGNAVPYFPKIVRAAHVASQLPLVVDYGAEVSQAAYTLARNRQGLHSP